jgi:hypothetical protein
VCHKNAICVTSLQSSQECWPTWYHVNLTTPYPKGMQLCTYIYPHTVHTSHTPYPYLPTYSTHPIPLSAHIQYIPHTLICPHTVHTPYPSLPTYSTYLILSVVDEQCEHHHRVVPMELPRLRVRKNLSGEGGGESYP